MRENDDNYTIFLERIKQGDDAAYRELIESFGPALYKLALSILKNTQDAEDAVMLTYKELVQKSKYIKYPRALRSWLYTTVYRKSLNIMRANKHSRAVVDPKLEDYINIDVTQLPDLSEKYFIAECFRKLTEEQYTVLTMRISGVTIRETAQILNKTVAQVKYLYKTAREVFIKYYNEEEE